MRISNTCGWVEEKDGLIHGLTPDYDIVDMERYRMLCGKYVFVDGVAFLEYDHGEIYPPPESSDLEVCPDCIVIYAMETL